MGVLGHMRHYPGPGAAAGAYAGVVRVLLTTIVLSVNWEEVFSKQTCTQCVAMLRMRSTILLEGNFTIKKAAFTKLSPVFIMTHDLKDLH